MIPGQNSMYQVDEDLLDGIADALVGEGYLVLDEFLPIELSQALLEQLDQSQSASFKAAGVGRQQDFQQLETVRADKIQWLTSGLPASADFLAWMEQVRAGLNRRLFMGLFDYESHFAFYPVGAFYKKHLDAFRVRPAGSQTNRVLSTVFYLNKDWRSDEGGELVIYAESSDEVIKKIEPIFGRMVIFLSEKFPHEVLPATRERKSIAGWFRVNEGIL